jgi:hypothetical protein
VRPFNYSPNTKSICNNLSCVTPGTFTPGVERYTFVGTVNLGAASSIPATCCEVRLSYSICCRSNNIATGGASSNYYTEATINRCLSTPIRNSSPRLLNEPFINICSGQPFVYNAGAIDPDLDSLSYSFVPALTANNTSISYVTPYSAQFPMPWTGPANGSFPDGIGCNPQTGDIWFTPGGNNLSGIPCVQIQEWRRDSNGTMRLLGTTRRDYFAIVNLCAPNNPTYIFPPGFSASQTQYEVCAGKTLCFDILARDTDATDTTYLSWDGALSGLGATFTPNYNPLQRDSLGPRLDNYKFCWTPTSAMAHELPYQFTVSARDNRAPIAGSAMRSFSIRVLYKDSIRIQSRSDTVSLCIGSRDTLRTNFYSVNPQLSYQWYRNGVALSNATSSYFVIDSFTASMSGNYSLKISGRCDFDSTFVVTVIPKSKTRPVITITTNDTTICPGQALTFNTFISDTLSAPLTNINWHLTSSNSIISSAGANRIFTTHLMSLVDSIYATPVFANTANACLDTVGVRSNSIRLPSAAVHQNITITADKSMICAGEAVTFTATNSIQPDSTYFQWTINGFSAGSNSPSFTAHPDPTDTITVSVISSKYCLQNPTQISNALYVPHYPATTVVQTLNNVSVCSGKSLNWPIFVSGVNLRYTWFKDGVFMKSDTSNRYIIPSVQYSDSGNYQVSVMGQCDTLRGVSAQLSVPVQASVDVQPASAMNVCAGSSVHIPVSVSGSVNRYEWRRNGAIVSGNNSPVLHFPSFSLMHAGHYYLRVYGVCDTTQSDSVFITTIPSPAFSRHPQSRDACVGEQVVFQAAASGNVNAFYWSRNFVPISGTNDSTLLISSAQVSHGGLYRMHAAGSCDTVVSNPASLLVLPPPAIDTIYGPVVSDTSTVQTYNVMSLAGNYYQWFIHNGIILSGQNTHQVNVRWISTDSCALVVMVHVIPGCTDTTYLVVNTSSSVGMAQLNELDQLRIFPNPSHGEFTINTDFTIQQTEVYGIDGRKISHEYDAQTRTLHIRNKGMYVLEVETEKGKIRKRIVVQ